MGPQAVPREAFWSGLHCWPEGLLMRSTVFRFGYLLARRIGTHAFGGLIVHCSSCFPNNSRLFFPCPIPFWTLEFLVSSVQASNGVQCPQCPVSSVLCPVPSAWCSVPSVQWPMSSVSSVSSAQCPVPSAQCPVFKCPQCPVPTIQCPVFNVFVQCAVSSVQVSSV